GRTTRRLEPWKRSRRAPDRRHGFLDRAEKRREREQTRRFERAPFDGKRRQNLRNVRGGAKREESVRREVPGRLRRRGKQLGDPRRIAGGRKTREPLIAHRRHREAADHLDDAIEFESAKDSRRHERSRNPSVRVSDVVDQTRDISRAKTVIDVHDGYT